jgi:hypothetical protein
MILSEMLLVYARYTSVWHKCKILATRVLCETQNYWIKMQDFEKKKCISCREQLLIGIDVMSSLYLILMISKVRCHIILLPPVKVIKHLFIGKNGISFMWNKYWNVFVIVSISVFIDNITIMYWSCVYAVVIMMRWLLMSAHKPGFDPWTSRL